MESPKDGKSSNTDIISNLPADILELILTYLPIRDTVRTSILSKDWRYRWGTVPYLVFDDCCCSSIDESKALASIIDHVLQHHTGSIRVFKIIGIGAIPEIDRWIVLVCQRSIEGLVLEFWGQERYKLDSCLCQYESLVKLKLTDCLLSVPHFFEGFKSLKCLYLQFVTMEEDALEKLISSCPLLESLTFIDFQKSYDNLKIDARNLRYLDMGGRFGNITFVHAMDRLLVFYFEQNSEEGIILDTRLTEILTNLPSIQRLRLREDSLFDFSFGLRPESMPVQCKGLHYLSISIDFGWLNQCLAAHYLFRCSPNLTKLVVEISYDGTKDQGLWGDTGKCYWEFRKLRRVEIWDFNFFSLGGELEFVQFLLANSPVLEKMVLIPCQALQIDLKDVKQICGFKRSSAEVKNRYVDSSGRLLR